VGIDDPDDPDDPDVPPDDPSDPQSRRPPPETRYRQDYDADLRAACAAQERTEPVGPSEPGARSKPGERTHHAQENGRHTHVDMSWERTAELSRLMWAEYKRRWPPEERSAGDEGDDSRSSGNQDADGGPGSARSDELERECDNIAEKERETVSPRLRDIESCDPDRCLTGFEFRLKGRDRIKEKVAKGMEETGLSVKDAVASVPDAIRYTFQYDETGYADGVRADIERMVDQGFVLSILKNSWSADQYKGINSQWIEPESGQRFELQFHTRISFEAKQITHSAYERLRSGQPDPLEHLVLEAYQAKVTAAVPIPPGAAEIPDYPPRDRNAR
jgi:hypothetical protein